MCTCVQRGKVGAEMRPSRVIASQEMSTGLRVQVPAAVRMQEVELG